MAGAQKPKAPPPASAPASPPDRPRRREGRFWTWIWLALGVTLLLAFVYAPPLVVLHGMPRFSLSPGVQDLANALQWKHEELFYPLLPAAYEPGEMPSSLLWLTPVPIRLRALTSPAKPVRENAIASFEWVSGLYDSTLQHGYPAALLKICEQSDTDLARLCLWLFLAGIDEERFLGPQNKRAREKLFEVLSPIQALHGDPLMVLFFSRLYNEDCEPEDVEQTRQALAEYLRGSISPMPKSSQWCRQLSATTPFYLLHPFDLSVIDQPRISLYGQLVQWNVLPENPADLDQVPHDKLEYFQFIFWFHQERSLRYFNPDKPDSDLDYYRCWQAVAPTCAQQHFTCSLADTRVADLFFAYYKGCDPTDCYMLDLGEIQELMAPVQQRRFFELLADWLCAAPGQLSDRPLKLKTLNQLLWLLENPTKVYPRFDLDEIKHAFVERVSRSLWKDERSPDRWEAPAPGQPDDERVLLPPLTYGQRFDAILEQWPPPPEKTPATPAGQSSSAGPAGQTPQDTKY